MPKLNSWNIRNLPRQTNSTFNFFY